MFKELASKIFPSQNDRDLKRLGKVVDATNALEPDVEPLTDDQLRERYAGLRKRFREEVDQQVGGKKLEIEDEVKIENKVLDSLAPECFAIVREVSKRTLGMRHFDVQIIGGMGLHEGMACEMRTGEGKTLAATLPVCLNALAQRGVHVVTVNDYLAKRDAEWMGPIYGFLGLTVGSILPDISDEERKAAYGSDITYGTNNEFGFDYLRDNMKFEKEQQTQRPLNFAIVDEVDSILIDEARTPLIISGPSNESTDLYRVTDAIIPKLITGQDFIVDEKSKTVVLTEEGIDKAQRLLEVKDLYDPANIEIHHHLNQSLRAHTLYKKDRDYVVRDGEVIIVDDFTGRLMPGRRWSDGLHQAVEAKEKVTVRQENRTLATITFQNFFKLYNKLSGMTGTADTEAAEFASIYELDVLIVPTNKPVIRKDHEDVIYKTEREKFHAVVEDIKDCNERGQPVLVGTVSIEKSERLSRLLKRKGVKHNVLNAKHHEKEAHIVAQAGRKGAVTISTNMAGRGTDIILGGNPEFLANDEVKQIEDPEEREAAFNEAFEKWKDICDAEQKDVLEAGGLHIIGTERHEARRIDNQLRGRAGRQGDPGSSRFYLSLEDDLMRIFGSERIRGMMETLGMEEGEPIEHRWVTRAIINAQKKVEGHNFDIRKNVFEYDETMNLQRKGIYGWRQLYLDGVDTREETLLEIDEYVDELIEYNVDPKMHRDDWNVKGLLEASDRVFDYELHQEDPEEIRKMGPEDIRMQLAEAAHKRYEAREEELGEDVMRQLEKIFHLQAIDRQWVDHLSAMQALREGIGLRGYGQRDPKLEYKKEGYELFRQMEHNIKSEVLTKLFRVRIEQQPQAQPRPRFAQATATKPAAPAAVGSTAPAPQGGNGPAGPPPESPKQPSGAGEELVQRAAAAAAARGPRQTFTNRGAGSKPQVSTSKTVRKDKKIGRNDPCPCGSGKKYKKCHGRAA